MVPLSPFVRYFYRIDKSPRFPPYGSLPLSLYPVEKKIPHGVIIAEIRRLSNDFFPSRPVLHPPFRLFRFSPSRVPKRNDERCWIDGRRAIEKQRTRSTRRYESVGEGEGTEQDVQKLRLRVDCCLNTPSNTDSEMKQMFPANIQ